jgi:hypothetical protein
MTTFDDREKAFEAKFRLEQDMEFKALMRRDKLLGLWAAEQMGLEGDAAQAYAQALIEGDIDGSGHDVALKVARDFAAKGVDIAEADVRGQIVLLQDLAHEQLIAELSQ